MNWEAYHEQYTLLNYQLDLHVSNLTDKDRMRYDACVHLVEEGKTLREIEKDYGISISVLDKWIHGELSMISNELYRSVCKQFHYNKHHYRRRSK